VIANTEIANPILLPEYIWALADPERLTGERGYYLTAFG